MKKVFLLFSIVAGASAFAQQDIFDVQKHLQLRNKTFFLPAQPPLTPYLTNKEMKPVLNLPGKVYLLPGGDSVLYDIGKMPVVKPDMRLHTTMPNVSTRPLIPGSNWPGAPVPGEMPNAAKPFSDYLSQQSK